jgi:hypothetical protein
MFSVHRHTDARLVSPLLVVTLMVTAGVPMPAPRTTIAVSGTPWGLSTCYIGATAGNVRFDITDVQETSCAVSADCRAMYRAASCVLAAWRASPWNKMKRQGTRAP